LDDKTKSQLKAVLKSLPSPVRLVFFTQEYPCPMCREQRSILEELTSLSDRIRLEVHDFVLDGDAAMKYGVSKIPATAVIGKEDYGIRFYGLTAGYEFTSLLEAVLMVSSGRTGLHPELEQLAGALDRPVHIQVMVTLTCPYCPKTAHSAHQLAMASKNIRADVVDVAEFPQLSKKYDVGGVPRTIINETHAVEGQLAAEALYVEILKAVNPEEYRQLEDSLREAQGIRKVKPAQESHVYEVIIVGGGPAAMSAAIYAARKELDVLLSAKDLGGQITYTALVENYLGFAGVSGQDMAEIFKSHVESYPIAESLGENVTAITKEDGRFAITTEGGKRFWGNSLIFCTGKEYRRLGVPNEERFIGRGIAFCATCDAPLFKGRRVAVVGGGNSAFTAVRDLIGFASEIHLVHRREEFTADPALQREVLNTESITIHKNSLVSEILGKETLEGMKIKSTSGDGEREILVDGIFLEIGLTPNSAPARGLIDLNPAGEIPADRDCATSLPGFFAAGDVTDTAEKQISIAVGDGARAALAAHKYLLKAGLTRSKAAAGESWQ
jgi:thioredoxin-disulfide reductase